MDEKKMIPCIYMSMGRAVTGFGQKTIFEDGDLLKLAREYGNTGADELLIFDFSSNDAEHDEAIGWIKKICQERNKQHNCSHIIFFRCLRPNIKE